MQNAALITAKDLLFGVSVYTPLSDADFKFNLISPFKTQIIDLFNSGHSASQILDALVKHYGDERLVPGPSTLHMFIKQLQGASVGDSLANKRDTAKRILTAMHLASNDCIKFELETFRARDRYGFSSALLDAYARYLFSTREAPRSLGRESIHFTISDCIENELAGVFFHIGSLADRINKLHALQRVDDSAYFNRLTDVLSTVECQIRKLIIDACIDIQAIERSTEQEIREPAKRNLPPECRSQGDPPP